MSFRSRWYIVYVSQVEAGTLKDACEYVFGGRERIFNFSHENTVSEEVFDDYNYFSRDVELS